jgi:hypothetical protein
MTMTNGEIKKLTLWLTLIGTAAWALNMVRQAQQ